MAKLYVSSGEYERCVDAPDHKAGAVKAILKIAEMENRPDLGWLTFVSEHTFDVENAAENDVFILTEQLLREVGMADLYDFSATDDLQPDEFNE